MADGDSPHLDIRRFQRGDGERVRELNELAMATTPEYVPEAPDEDLDAVHHHYLEDEGEFIVGIVDDTIVATGAFTPPNEWKEAYVNLDSDTTELTRMRVDPQCHGQGFGSAIYDELEQRAQSDGYQRFILDTGTENDVARAFYESLGFECRREVPVDFGDLTIELALYEKFIDE